MNLPSQFLQRMEAMLGDEFAAFGESFHRERYSGLRANLLKTSVEKFQQIQPFSLESIPWCDSGFYYDGPAELERGLRPGKHPLHEAGLYYIQEPSAMAVAQAGSAVIRAALEESDGADSAFEGSGGEKIFRVLDLCAAPGGKSSQLASLMGGRGFLISNEIVPGRAKILSQNMERMGLTNGIVVSHSPEELAQRFPCCFDLIVADAPCSGEGMFRKDEDTVGQWSPENVRMCADRQKDILEDAIAMLTPGGTLIYSTCTFAPAENEEIVLWILRNYPRMEIVSADFSDEAKALFEPGRPEWITGEFGCDTEDLAGDMGAFVMADDETEAVRRSYRLWPQKLKGEGHFLAVFRKAGPEEVPGDIEYDWDQEERDRVWIGGAKPPKKGKKVKGASKGFGNQILKKPPVEWREFAEEFFDDDRAALNRICGVGSQLLLFGEQLYAVNADCPDLSGLTVMRAGLHLGTVKKGRFEPSHALALALTPAMITDLHLEDQCFRLAIAGGDNAAAYDLAARYLKGEALAVSPEGRLPRDGWNLVTYEGYPLGWGKISEGMVKNHYPKGLRWV